MGGVERLDPSSRTTWRLTLGSSERLSSREAYHHDGALPDILLDGIVGEKGTAPEGQLESPYKQKTASQTHISCRCGSMRLTFNSVCSFC